MDIKQTTSNAVVKAVKKPKKVTKVYYVPAYKGEAAHTNGMLFMQDYLKVKTGREIKVVNVASYNANNSDSVQWRLKNPDTDLIGVYFDGGEREPLHNQMTFLQLVRKTDAKYVYKFVVKPKKLKRRKIKFKEVEKVKVVEKRKRPKKKTPPKKKGWLGWLLW
ncbi:hypothetical protein [Candidatus Phytoplasma pruni]|uniref:Uncharacterized protein n=1 Tax=Candidatus Phytoplasma pruni TaxID=479893 RepID=A0A851HK57_9MOLU|nr:hypothetical protein [Candidatus Phytoplasma pruni]NWN45819.1 hypothetical protein [Candidatus Phytoplasma pruni]